MQIFASIYWLIGQLLAPIINGMTLAVEAFLPLDISKAVVVVGFYIIGLWVFEFAKRRLRNVLARLICMLAIFFIITAGVSASDDHITRDSFMFGPYVDFIDKYFGGRS